MYFDTIDICKAYYMYASLYHGGQFSDTYRIFGRLNDIKFKPGPMLSVESLEDNARAIFDNLVESHGFEPYQSEER